MQRIGFLIPSKIPVTGQSIISYLVKDNYPGALVIELNGKFFLNLRRAFMAKRCDVLYYTPSRSQLGAVRDLVYLKLLRPISLVAHIHGDNLSSWLFRKNLRKSRIIVITERTERRLLNFGFNKSQITRIENPMELSRLRVKEDFSERVVYFSNLMMSKGFDKFLSLTEKNFKYRLECAGGNIEGFTIPLGLVYHGVLSGKEKVDFLQSADILIFYSTYVEESFPVVLIECLFYGILPIVKRHNGIENLFLGYEFLWVDTYDEVIEILRNEVALVDCVRNYKENLRNIEGDILERFSLDMFKSKIDKTLREL